MTLYTVVEEDYSVTVYRTAKSVCDAHANNYCFEDTRYADSDLEPATASDIANRLRKEGVVRLYPLDGGDWHYKIDKQSKSHIFG